MKRILSIDGGGIKGTCPASFLASLEESLPQPIGRYFDLIAGTSTGGILAIGLALGIPAKQLLNLYVEHGPEIFGQQSEPRGVATWCRSKLMSSKRLFKGKHDETSLRRVLSEVLEGRLISDAKTRLLVPAWDADNRSVYIYKTAHHPRLKIDYRKPALDAAMATAAAPTFFRRHRTVDDVGLLDGGVWANNPTGIAVVEAITLLGWRANDLKVLSLGCIDEVYMLSENPGVLGLGGKAMSLFMDGQSSSSMGIAKLITEHPHQGNSVFRFAPKAPLDLFALDDTSKIQQLKGLGASMARKASAELEPIFFNETAAEFQPFYTLEGA